MRGERSMSLMLRRWGRRIGFRLDVHFRAFDPVKENSRRLFPNDLPEAGPGSATSHRSLVRPFTPLGFRLVPTRGV